MHDLPTMLSRFFGSFQLAVYDVRYGVRTLAKDRGFTIVAVITLGLGIGANTAIFSIINAVLLRPLPFADQSRLVMIRTAKDRNGVHTEGGASFPDFEDWKARSISIYAMAGFNSDGMTLSGAGAAEIVPGIRVTPGFFELLGVSPVLGRTFTPDEGRAGGPKVTMIGEAFWKTRFAGTPDVLGRTIRIDEESYTIVGVMPAEFSITGSGTPSGVCIPLTPRSLDRYPRGSHFFSVLGRLSGKASVNQAQVEMTAIAEQLARQYPDTNSELGAKVVPLVDARVGEFKSALWVMLGVVAFVLLIACANIVNLSLSRNATRRKEMVVRAALGAGRVRLIQQLLIESTMLALSGGAFALLLAAATTRLLASLLSRNFQVPRLGSASVDAAVMLFTLGVAMVTGILFGIIPAISTTSTDLTAGLNEAGRAATDSPRGRKVRGLLVMAETAMALVLLAGAGVLLRTFQELRGAALGLQPDKLAIVRYSLPKTKYAEAAARAPFFAQVLDAARALPGVRGAALVSNLPLGGSSSSMSFEIVGRPAPPGSWWESAFNVAGAGYFQTMGIPLFAGREFSDRDNVTSPKVVVVNQSAARAFWPDETLTNTIGHQIKLNTDNDVATTFTVVGVTGDVRQFDLGRAPEPEIFLNYDQVSKRWSYPTLVVRTEADPALISGALRDMSVSIDPDVPVTRVRTMEEVLSAAVAAPRTYALLLSIFAGLALVLALVGTYGVVSYSVARRTQEIGIRLALGADKQDILALMLRHGLGLTAAGTLIGIGGALEATRLLTKLVPTARSGDWLTLAVTALLLLAVATAAILMPARRATTVMPSQALRCQ